MLEFDDAADALLALPDFFFPALLSLPLGVAETNLGLDDLLLLPLPLLLRLPALLIDLERDLETPLFDRDPLREREETDFAGELPGLLDLRDPRDEDLDPEREERLPELSILYLRCYYHETVIPFAFRSEIGSNKLNISHHGTVWRFHNIFLLTVTMSQGTVKLHATATYTQMHACYIY